ncbi:MAG: hypothetical protein R3E44_07155 [Paracoccaceae bacterium]
MSGTGDRYDYLGRLRRQRLEEEMRDRRLAAIKAAARVSVQVTSDGVTVNELRFEAPPTLGQLIEQAGADAFVISVERLRGAKGEAGTAEAV